MSGQCAFAGGADDCSGRLEWHHVIKQQRLKAKFRHGARWDWRRQCWMPADRHDPITDAQAAADTHVITLELVLGDRRNRVWMCVRHHELVTKGMLKSPVPSSVFELAREFGIDGMLENDLARQT